MSVKALNQFVGRLALNASGVKATGVDGSGEFEGYASTRKLDSDRDIVQEGAFKRTIDHHSGKGLALLWFHDPTQPIGSLELLGEDSKGLLVKGIVDVDTQRGHDVYSGMVKGYIDRMSIGYVAKRARWDAARKCRLLDEVALREVSMITREFAANDEALVTSIKSASASIHQWVNAEGYGGTSLDIYTAAGAIEELVAELRALFDSGTLAELGAGIATAQTAQDDAVDTKDSGGSRTAHPAGDVGGSALATLLRDTVKAATQSPDEAKAADLLRSAFADLRG